MLMIRSVCQRCGAHFLLKPGISNMTDYCETCIRFGMGGQKLSPERLAHMNRNWAWEKANVGDVGANRPGIISPFGAVGESGPVTFMGHSFIRRRINAEKKP